MADPRKSKTLSEESGTSSSTANKKVTFSSESKQQRLEDTRKHRPSRKRSHSFSEGVSTANTTGKRWRGGGGGGLKHRINGSKNNVLPSKFLLGGNIRDPLNLNSLADERISKIVNAITPESSPLPTPKHRKAEYKIEVLIPPNISDPLNLNGDKTEQEFESELISPVPKRRRYRKPRPRNPKHKPRQAVNNSSESEEEVGDGKQETNEQPDDDHPSKPSDSTASSEVAFAKPSKAPKRPTSMPGPITLKRSKSVSGPFSNPATNEIVSPVIPQPGQKREPKPPPKSTMTAGAPKFHAKDKMFEYGNYNRYYGYRNPGNQDDIRLKYFRPEWFVDRDVLDIGCNVGNITMSVGKNFNVRSITGIDIDKRLIQTAQKNLRRFARYKPLEMNGDKPFPQSMPMLYGPLDPCGASSSSSTTDNPYPNNVKFVAGNYVLDNDVLVDAVQPEFDTLLCLSTTKWLHLNFGDDGLKRAFKRMYAQLRPGGRLVLEAQPFSSYRKKKKMTERIFKNFQTIKLKPESFSDYLLHEVGFSSSECIAVPNHESKGFQRPLQVFTKLPPMSMRSESSCHTTPYVTPYSTPFDAAPKDDEKRPRYSFMSSAEEPHQQAVQPKEFMPYGSPADFERVDYPPTYSGNGHSGITPGYSGPSPDAGPRLGSPDSPVYTGPPPGTFSGASTPGNQYDDSSPRFSGPTPHYDPNYSGYTPSYEGPSTLSPQFSPGNATPLHPPSTPGTTNNSPVMTSPQIQQAEITGNTTPHPGPSGSPAENPPTYSWYGNTSSGNTTPQAAFSPPSNLHMGTPSEGGDSSPNTPPPQSPLERSQSASPHQP